MDSVTAQQVTGITEILKTVLHPHNPTRQSQEAQIHNLRQQHPNQLVVCLLHVILQQSDLSARTLATVLLRQMFSNISPPGLQAWKKLNPTVQEEVKTQLLVAIRRESQATVRKRLAQTIGDLAVTIFAGDEPGRWDTLMPSLFQCVLSEENAWVNIGFMILSALFTFFHDQLLKERETLFQVFKKHLESEDLEVRISCIDAICSLLGIVYTPDAMYFSQLLSPLMKSIIWIIGQHQGKGEQALKHFRDFVETEPKFFKDRIQLTLEFVQHIFGLQIQHVYLKYLAVLSIVSLVQRLQEVFKVNQQVCLQISQLIFNFMVSANEEVDQSWSIPPEGFHEELNEEGVQIEYGNLGRKLISKMLDSVGDQILMPFLLNLVQESLNPSVTDWRIRYAALVTITELAQYIKDQNKIGQIVQILQAHIAPNAYPKLRYAVYACLEKLSDDYQQEFQTTHHLTVVPILLAGLDDSIQRVIGADLKAINKFMEFSGQTLATQYVATFLPKLIVRLSQQNCSFVITEALDAINSFAESCKSQFTVYFNDCLGFLFTIIAKYTDDIYKKLRGKAIECITLLCNIVGKTVFAGYSTQVIQLLRDLQASTPPDDPLQAYLLAGWQKLSVTLGSDFVQYLPQVIRYLLQVLKSQAQISISTEPDQPVSLQSLLGEQKITIAIDEIETKEIALQTIITIINVLRGHYVTFFQETGEVVLPLVNYSHNQNIRQSAASCCACLVMSVKQSNHPQAVQTCITAARQMLQQIWKATDQEYDTETMPVQLTAIKSLIKTPGVEFLTAEEVNAIGENMIRILDASLQRRQRNKDIIDELSSEDEEEDKIVDVLNKKDEDSLHTAISEVLSSLFETHRTLSLNIVEYLYNNVLTKFLAPDSEINDQKFAILVIDDFIEHLGPDLVGNKWSSLAEALVKFVVHPNQSIRQGAAYGLGILAANSTQQTFTPWAPSILEALNNGLFLQRTKTQTDFLYARDNVVAAIGKLIKFQHASIDTQSIVPSWVQLLPIRKDKAQARISHDLLTDLAINNLALVVGNQNQRLLHVLGVFSDILETKLVEHQSVPKIRQIVQAVLNQSGTQGVWTALTELQQKKLQKIIN